jgi:hypothetical protein
MEGRTFLYIKLYGVKSENIIIVAVYDLTVNFRFF